MEKDTENLRRAEPATGEGVRQAGAYDKNLSNFPASGIIAAQSGRSAAW